MKSIKKILLLSLSLIIILTMLSACGSQKSSQDIAPESAIDSDSGDFGGMTFEDKEKPGDMDSEVDSSNLEPSKVIVRFFINMETVEFDKSISTLENLISKNNAYVENSNISLGSYYDQSIYRNAEYVIRVPRDNIDKFINETSSIGKVTNKEESKEDVTMHYRDTESRLNVLNIKEDRILELLKKAEKMEDIIALENSLSDLIYEKESLTGVLKSLDNKVDFSTVTISLREVQKLSTIDDSKTGFGQRMANALSDSLYRFRLNIENLFIGLIYALPAIVILSLIAYGGYRISRIYIRKNSNKDNIEK